MSLTDLLKGGPQFVVNFKSAREVVCDKGQSRGPPRDHLAAKGCLGFVEEFDA